MYEIISDVPPRTKILAPPLYIQYILYIYQLSLVPPPIFIRGGPHATYVLVLYMYLNCNVIVLVYTCTLYVLMYTRSYHISKCDKNDDKENSKSSRILLLNLI